MAYDLVIKNGKMIDGTGAPARHADIAVTDGKIVEIGEIDGRGKREIDASDLVVSPGFVDPHTHYDAQICWDTAISPSSWHGVTSVVTGNCGVGIAPCRPESREIATIDLVAVEGVPYDALKAGVTWDWESFPEFMNAAARRGTALNVGFLAPLTPFRHFVMGEESMQRAATAEETASIKALLKEAVGAGALGFSTTLMTQHVGYKGLPLACRNASRDELEAYANALKELGKGTIEIALTQDVAVLSDSEYDLLDALLTESNRPVTWVALNDREDKPTACQDSLVKSAPLRRRGGIPQVSAVPLMRDVSMRNPFVFASCVTFHQVYNKSKEEQAGYYRDPAFRQSFREDLKTPKTFSGKWDQIRVTEVKNPALKSIQGLTIEEVARQRGVDGVDALLDVTLEDDFEVEFSLAFFNVTESRHGELLQAEGTLIGLADGGAHVDTTCDARYTTHLLGKWVRERQIMTLERAVARLTSEPADFFGIKGRGRLKVGNAADIAIFDPETVAPEPRWRNSYDLPGGSKRIVIGSRGIEYTMVNGTMVWENGQQTEARAGQILRS